MLKNSIQHFQYIKEKERIELSKLLKFMRIPVYILITLNTIEIIRKNFYPNTEFFLSFIFWAITILLILYWIPDKKEYEEWVKKKTILLFRFLNLNIQIDFLVYCSCVQCNSYSLIICFFL